MHRQLQNNKLYINLLGLYNTETLDWIGLWTRDLLKQLGLCSVLSLLFSVVSLSFYLR